jgi:ribosomal protein S18 acetylase RimI-like enzyme
MTPHPTITLRPANPEEAAIIAGIVNAAYAKWIAVIGRKPRPMQTDYQRALLEHTFDVAVENGQIVGLIETMQRDDHLWIENVAVVPAAQGRGIGRYLLAHAERQAIETGTFEIRLLTNGAFDANLSLYRRLGYVVDREEDFMNGTTVYMSKKLAR